MAFKVTYSDFFVEEYRTQREAEKRILLALANGVLVESIENTEDNSKIYSLMWGVEIQEEN